MSFFRFMWFRRFIRRNTTPIPYRKALKYRNILSVTYALCAWNMLGFIIYEYAKGRGTKDAYGIEQSEIDKLSPAQQFALASGMERAKIIRSSNINETIEFKLEDYEHLKRQKDKPIDVDDDEDNVA